MVRRAELRKRRFEQSMHPGVISRRFAAQKEIMIDQQAVYFSEIAEVEAKVKSICEAAGVPTIQVRDYVNVGRKCYSIAKRFSQATRDQEAQRVVTHWAARGLNGPLLQKSCLAGGCNVTAPAAVCYDPCPHGMEKHTFPQPAYESQVAAHKADPDAHWLLGFQFEVNPREWDHSGTDPGGVVGVTTVMAAMQTPATLNGRAYGGGAGSGWTGYIEIYDKNPLFEVYFMLGSVTNVNYYITVGGWSGTPESNHRKFGIKIANGQLRIISADNATYSESGNLMTLLINTWYRVRVKLFSGVQIQAWVNGVSVGTKTTNLPSSVLEWSRSIFEAHVTTLEAVGKRFFVGIARIRHDY